MKYPVKTSGSCVSQPARTSRPTKWLKQLAAIAGLAMMFPGGKVMAAPITPRVSNIVLVHGAFVDGSSWAQVIAKLQALGYHVTAVQNPLTSLSDDVEATEKVLRRQKGDVLLVGHSWAGAVITQAGNAANVKGLVYLSALVPDNGESVADLLQRLHSPMSGLSPDAQGLIWLDDPTQFQHVMAADIPMRTVRTLASTQQPIAALCFTGKIGRAAWHDKPSWYLQTENDQALPPAAQQIIAQQIGAKVTSIRSSHMSLLSHPDELVKLIDRAAQEAAR